MLATTDLVNIQPCISCETNIALVWFSADSQSAVLGIGTATPTYHEGLFLDTRLLKDGMQGGQSVLEHVLWADVHLGHHEENWHLQGQSYPHVLLAHANNTCMSNTHSASRVFTLPQNVHLPARVEEGCRCSQGERPQVDVHKDLAEHAVSPDWLQYPAASFDA